MWGGDISGEGTQFDSTYYKIREPMQGFSFNLILGGSGSITEKIKFDGGVLIGARQVEKDCPDSFIGYACYADRSPNISYKMNTGVILLAGLEEFSLGLRATKVSTQLVFGLKF